jgi:hypothetical protein
MTRAERARAPQFSVGGVLGKGFSIWARSLVTLVVLMVIIYSPLIVYQGVRIAGGTVPEVMRGLGFLEPRYWIERLLNALATAAVIYTVFRRLRGERARIADSLRHCMSRLLPVLGTALLYIVATTGPMIPFYLVFKASPPAGIALLLLGSAAALFFSLMLWVVVPPVVVENQGPIGALKRSVALTHGKKGQIFLINLVVGLVAAVPFVIVMFLTEGNPDAFAAAQLPVTILVGALGATMTAVGYHDLRLAKEGVGVDELLKVFD